MAIAFGTQTANGSGVGTSSISVPYPTGITGGDMLILYMANKYPSNGPTTPSGWTLGAQASGGHGSSGVQTGNVYITAYWKVADGTETGNQAVTITSGNSAYGQILRYTKAAEKPWISPVFTSGAQNTPGLAWSVVSGADPGLVTGDVLLALSANNTSSITWTAEACVVTGITFAAAVERRDSSTTQGDDCGILATEHTVTAGTSSGTIAYAATASGTTTDAPCGATIFVRLREDSAVRTPVFGADSTSANGTTSVNPDYPSGVAAGDILFLHISGKYPPNLPTTPSGWTLLGSVSSATGITGADNGDVFTSVYYKIATTTHSGAIGAVTVTGGNSVCALVSRFRPYSTLDQLSFATKTATTEAEATSHSWAPGSDPGFKANDLVLVFVGLNTDLGFAFTGWSCTGTGCSFSDFVTQGGTLSTANGDDCGGRRHESVVQSGTSSGNPTIVATTATSATCAVVIVRVRETSYSPALYSGAWGGVWRGVHRGVW